MNPNRLLARPWSDWIKPAIVIAESELDLAALPEAVGAFVRQIVRDALDD